MGQIERVNLFYWEIGRGNLFESIYVCPYIFFMGQMEHIEEPLARLIFMPLLLLLLTVIAIAIAYCYCYCYCLLLLLLPTCVARRASDSGRRSEASPPPCTPPIDSSICVWQDTEITCWLFIKKIKILAPKKILAPGPAYVYFRSRIILLVFYIENKGHVPARSHLPGLHRHRIAADTHQK